MIDVGQWKGSLFIPNPKNDANPRWATGTRTFRFTTDENDSRAVGAVDLLQMQLIQQQVLYKQSKKIFLLVRNADIVRDTVSRR